MSALAINPPPPGSIFFPPTFSLIGSYLQLLVCIYYSLYVLINLLLFKIWKRIYLPCLRSRVT
jgi:hypothetical protein